MNEPNTIVLDGRKPARRTYTCVCREVDGRFLGTPEVVRVEASNAEDAKRWAEQRTGLPLYDLYLGRISDSWLRNHGKL